MSNFIYAFDRETTIVITFTARGRFALGCLIEDNLQIRKVVF